MSSLTRSPLRLLLRIQSTLTALQARWSYPRNHYYLCYASLLALCYANATMPTFCLSASQLPCQTSNPPCPSNRWVAMLPLRSAPLIALLVAGEDWSCSLLEHLFTCWDIILSLCYLNASIYLVKGGRLGLLPGVLFHSCCPIFPHTGVMFLDFWVPWERDMCISYRDLSAHSGGFSGLVLPLSKCLVTRILRLIGSFREKEYPSLTVRACDGLSSNTPAGFKLSKAVPTVMLKMGIC